ncbi:MAG: pyruvate kinase [Bryobacteraceae bacterium]
MPTSPLMRNTKIVATLGPASDSPEMIGKLLAAGVDVFRLNASHGTQDQHLARLGRVREVARQMGRHAGVLLDLQGPKIRLGQFEGGTATLVDGSRFTITTDTILGTAKAACCTYQDLAKDAKPGDRILLADGAVELRAIKTDGTAVECEVVSGGVISDRKGINLPGVAVSTPSLTKKDMADLRFGVEAGVDMVALSFVRRRDDILRLKHFLEEHDAPLPVIAKIEKPEAWTNLDEIVAESDGLMVARGDLGVEVALEKVPFIQRSIIQRARAQGRFTITATQMLESMIENAFPTRAEVTDIANAISDGTDAIMLSAETSTGKHPVEAVKVMARVAEEAECSLGVDAQVANQEKTKRPDIIADAAYHAARQLGAVAIAVFTTTGASARLVSRYRPPMPILALTPTEAVARQLNVVYGVRGIVTSMVPSTDEMVAQTDRLLAELGWAKSGDMVVFVSGQPIGKPGTTNMMKLHRVG